MRIRQFFILPLLAAGCAPAVEAPEQAGVGEPNVGNQDVGKPASEQFPDTAINLPIIPAGVKADRILVDKSDRTLVLFKADKEIARYHNIRFGDAPTGHKRFEGDE